MSFFNLTLCMLLLLFQYPYPFVRWLAFKVRLKTNFIVVLLLPLVFIGLVFYMSGLGYLVYSIRSKKYREQEWLLASLEKLRTSKDQVETMKNLVEEARLEEIPMANFYKEQNVLGIYASYSKEE